MPSDDQYNERRTYDMNHPMYRELNLLKEMFLDKIESMDINNKREIEGVYYKIEDVLKILTGRFDNVDLQIRQQKEMINAQVESQNTYLLQIEADLKKTKDKIDNVRSDFFWKYFIRILAAVSAATLIGIFSYLIKSSKI